MHNIIEVTNGIPRIEAYRLREPVTVSISADEPLAIIGENGSGKSLLVDILTGAHPLWGTDVKYDFTPSPHTKASENIRTVTFRDAYGSATGTYYQQRWNQWDTDESETVGAMLNGRCTKPEVFAGLCDVLGLDSLMSKKMIMLSSGELRRVQLAEVLQCEPRLVILDNPYIGLDANARKQVCDFLARINEAHHTMIIVVVSRTSDIPAFIRRVLPVEDGIVRPITDKGAYAAAYADTERAEAAAMTARGVAIMESLPHSTIPEDSEAVIECHNITIGYGARTILKNFSWTVHKGEHWALCGENGAGKSTLLSLVCADNPQAYACDISLFGNRRGGGESIWDIKKKIGYVSPEMFRFYKKNLPAIDIAASGLHDTIGLYKHVTDEERDKVMLMLKMFNAEHLAQRRYLQLSSGEQRLILLARAFVKDPELLILDEPYHGLDEPRRTLARNIINAFCKQPGKTLVMVTHYEDEYPELIDHKLVLKKHE